ncbi:circularly permuted type 2 ATP-grasp protein, partial [Arthrobacter sp. TB 23]
LDELVVKPVDGSGGKGLVIGPDASKEELDALRERVTADPRGWIAQPVLQLSTVPTMSGGQFSPRHVDLRPFAVNDGDDVWVLPGGLTRVAMKEGSLIVNSSQGGGSKDTWVVDEQNQTPVRPVVDTVRRPVQERVWPIESGWQDRQPEQQQQQADSVEAPAGGHRVNRGEDTVNA